MTLLASNTIEVMRLTSVVVFMVLWGDWELVNADQKSLIGDECNLNAARRRQKRERTAVEALDNNTPLALAWFGAASTLRAIPSIRSHTPLVCRTN